MAELSTVYAIALIRSHRRIRRPIPESAYEPRMEKGRPVPLAVEQAELFHRIVTDVLDALDLTPAQREHAVDLLREGLLKGATEDAGGSAWWPYWPHTMG